jgi:deoxyribonuclease V
VLACVDVDYAATDACAGCLVFAAWTDAVAAETHTSVTTLAAEYAPGELYRRELPPILDVLARVRAPLEAIVVDGYVWLAGHGHGLGAYLHEALGVPVIGVAKSAWTRPPFADEPAERRVVAVVRGGSAKPLFVTAVGVDPDAAAANVARMHGAHRLPTLLKAVDRLVRDARGARPAPR